MVMKKALYCIVSALMTTFLAGCSINEEQFTKGRIEEGIPTVVHLEFGVQGSQVYTKATETPTENESRVGNLYVMVFDNAGVRVPIRDDEGNDLGYFAPSSGLTQVTLSEGSVSFSVGSLSQATIVAVANITEDNVETVYTLKKTELDAIGTLEDFKKLTVPALKSVTRGNYMLMSGMSVEDISGAEGASTTLKLTLNRIDAKVYVELVSSPADKTWKNFSFKPRTWRVLRVPKQSRLVSFEHETHGGPWDEIGSEGPSEWDAEPLEGDTEKGYFDTREYEFANFNPYEEDNTLMYRGGNFSFYMPENREVAIASVTDYAERERRNEDRSFKNANPNSTYLEITGFISYTYTTTNNDGASETKVVNADVTFYVHLGSTSVSEGVTGNVNDYDTRQNGSYRYKITVAGVESIKVEVENQEGIDDKTRPGYEGHIVESSELVVVDAHYETRLISLNVADIDENLTWGVYTRFSDGGIYSGTGAPGEGLKDYKWIKFAINKHFGVSDNSRFKYPGDPSYDDDPDLTMAKIEETPHLLDIHQLVKYLKEKEANITISELETDGKIYITAFVDEYLYTSDPEGKITSETPQLFWKKCVDTDDRQMHILKPAGENIYSHDKHSSDIPSIITFTQKSIRTIYNKNADDEVLKTAWGMETTSDWSEDVSASARLQPGTVSAGSSTRDGRANCLKWMENNDWDDFVDFDNNDLLDDYKNAAYACLMRNRDEDGNGIIDKKEVKWYLAAIDQLTDIFIGQNALNSASRLYPQAPEDREDKTYWHYTSSSADGSNPWVLWAEEGASRGSFDDSRGKNGDYYSYRCIRNLGVDDESDYVIEDIQDIIFIDEDEPKDASDNYTLNLSRMNPKSLRNYTSSPIPAGEDENSVWSLPYEMFEVSAETRPEPDLDWDWKVEDWNIKYFVDFKNARNWSFYQNNEEDCPDGYRAPNLRELLIMSTRLPKESWPAYVVEEGFGHPRVESKAMYISKTAFSMCGVSPYTDSREGFIYDAESDKIFLQNNKNEIGYLRCIKDKIPN